MKLIQYRGEIDGLRALSVLAVVLFHFDFLSVTGGFYGVDVFFVISGYLISSLLFAEVDRTGTLSISNFYLRRTRRILPALLVVCLATYVLFALFVGEVQSPFPHFGQSLLATLFSASNIFFWQKAGYFSLDAWAEPLLHTWSLGVEEQFYLIIPLLLYWLSRAPGEVGRRKRYLAVFSCMAVLSFALCRYGADLVGRDFIFYMLPTRMWELLIGVLVSLILRRRMLTRLPHRWMNELLSVVGVAVMLYGFFNFHETTRIAEKSLVVTSGAALFLLFTNEATLVGRLFTSRPMRLTGNVSYSWYLWHWPLVSLSVMMEVKYPGLSSTAVRIGLCVLSYVLAFFSWKYVETPFRRIKNWLPCIKRLAPLFILLVGIGLVNALHVFGSSPIPSSSDSCRGLR
ncbi:acyltransferase [Pseudodesulfovibrio sp.]|uniref:acyltransferase family protein n=1 Tax=Pseudodesulfovibrio sp. TaxID=2035812 RepID=UPI002632B51F|nr:acyltransferase [Pseudodesulfovibrio sp.]MDD3312493.1 acyltransferase [Pseudodesulfovibrio sp.]